MTLLILVVLNITLLMVVLNSERSGNRTQKKVIEICNTYVICNSVLM